MKKMLFGLSLLSIVAAGMTTGCSDDGKKSEKCLSDYTAHCEDGMVLYCKVGSGALKGSVDRIESYSVGGMVMVCDESGALVQDKTCHDGRFVNYPDAPDRIEVDGVAHVCDGNVAKVSETCDSNSYEAKCANGKYVTCDQNIPVYADSFKLGMYTFECREDGSLWPASKCENDIFEESNEKYIFNADSLFVCEGNEIKLASNVEGTCIGNLRIYNDAEAGYKTQQCGDDSVCMEYEKTGYYYSSCINRDNVQDGCGADVTQFGSCDNNTLVFCSSSNPLKGKTITINCADNNRVCQKVNNEYGNECVLTCGAQDEITDFGTCDKSEHLLYCDQTGMQREADCTQSNKTCRFNGKYYDCQ